MSGTIAFDTEDLVRFTQELVMWGEENELTILELYCVLKFAQESIGETLGVETSETYECDA